MIDENVVHTLTSDLGSRLLYFDGGTGTMLQRAGLKPGELPERWNITHADEIVSLHKAYLDAGADIIKTNTFGANLLKYPLDLERVVQAAVANASRAVREAGHGYIALDIGPTGKLLKPMGDLDSEDAIRIFKKTIAAGIAAGSGGFDTVASLTTQPPEHSTTPTIDAILIETMNDVYEARMAVIAAKEALEEAGADLPIMVTTVYDEGGRSLTGSTPEVMAAVLGGMGVAALGMNCSLGPKAMVPLVKRLACCTSIPIIVNPNAGLPRTDESGGTVYDVGADEFAAVMAETVEAGAAVVGGCCGTTPEYIRKTVSLINKKREHPLPQLSGAKQCLSCEEIASGARKREEIAGKTSLAPARSRRESAVIASAAQIVPIGGEFPVLIGERINPTGKKRFKEALRQGDMPYIVSQALEQETAGAKVLDVNVGLPEIDECAVMVRAVCEIQSVCTLPLQIDTSSPKVMEAALRRVNGKALVNSVNGKQEVMDAVFPLVRKYGGVVVALTLDEGGIPPTAEGRVEIAKRIEERAAQYGIAKSDLVIDPLAMAVSADSRAAYQTLRAVGMLHDLGFHTILGVSNVSFGLPQRQWVTSAFFTMAAARGLSAAIMNPLSADMMRAYRCCALLAGQDENAAGYIGWCESDASLINKEGEHPRHCEAVSPKVGAAPRQPLNAEGRSNLAMPDEKSTLQSAIIRGLKANAASSTSALLETTAPLDIIDHHIIPALDEVGKRFEAKTLYLPQLLMSAEAASAAFEVIKRRMSKEAANGQGAGGKEVTEKRTVIIATVQGDIHDIGKNIVKVLLENYGFDVIDLGRDVPPQAIVDRCVTGHVMLVGLSALMTTTVPSMEATIKLLREKAPWAKVCVGGAVMTAEYASMIGADFYAKDAMATVGYAREVLG